jgi:5-methyltetrahydrofolate--homocysteine methyltransferase
MHPAASVCGLMLAHPQAEYFAVGKLDRDQVIDYALRKQQTIDETERALASVLGYEPTSAADTTLVNGQT